MKKFEEPKLNVEMMELEDVITTSNDPTECDDVCTEFDCPFDAGGFSLK